MPFEHKPGTGSLFKPRDRKNDRAPNLTGGAIVEIGDELYELDISAWTKESPKAGKWLSLSVKLKTVRPAARQPADDSDMDAAGLGNPDDRPF